MTPKKTKQPTAMDHACALARGRRNHEAVMLLSGTNRHDAHMTAADITRIYAAEIFHELLQAGIVTEVQRDSFITVATTR